MIVEAVAAFAPPTDLGRRIEAAMSAAVLQAYAEGVKEPSLIKQRMIDAAQLAKNSAQ